MPSVHSGSRSLLVAAPCRVRGDTRAATLGSDGHRGSGSRDRRSREQLGWIVRQSIETGTPDIDASLREQTPLDQGHGGVGFDKRLAAIYCEAAFVPDPARIIARVARPCGGCCIEQRAGHYRD